MRDCNKCSEISKRRNIKVSRAKNLPLSHEAPRRSARLKKVSENEKDLDLQQGYVMEKRVTRSSARGSKSISNLDNDCNGILLLGYGNVTCSAKSGKGSRSAGAEVGANLSENEKGLKLEKQYVIEKRLTRSSFGGSVTTSDQEDDFNGNLQQGYKKAASSMKSGKGSRRSTRLVGFGANLSENEKCLNLKQQCLIEKWMTRSSVQGSEIISNQDNNFEGILQQRHREAASSVQSGKASRRSTRLNSEKQYLIEKRMTRSSLRGNKLVNYQVNECISDEDSCKRVKILSKEEKARVCAGLSKPSTGKADKRFTRGSSRMKTVLLVEDAGNAPTGRPQNTVMSGERLHKRGVELCKRYETRRDVKDCGMRWGSGDENGERNVHVGKKRTSYLVEEVCQINQGWSREQELALRNAYFTVKPTPHFWKKVAKMVPGKSAEECFDRIHSDHLTPPQPRTRSRANKMKSSPLSFSASKLLSPAETKTEKLRCSRRKTLVAQKTVRQLLENQLKDQHYEADLFSVFEPTVDPTSFNFQEGTEFTSPAPDQETRFLARSSSIHEKHRSQLISESKGALVSPPVLKQIKNKALHERYIDILHRRDAKRKAESSKNARRSRDKHAKKESHSELNSIKAARDSMVFHAQDAINQFQSLQSNILDDNDDDDGDTSWSDEDESRDEL